MNNVVFAKAMLCILEANQLSSKIADEVLKYREEQPHSFGGLASGFQRLATRLESIATGSPPEKFNWSHEEKEALAALIKIAEHDPDPDLAVAASKVKHLFFPEG